MLFLQHAFSVLKEEDVHQYDDVNHVYMNLAYCLVSPFLIFIVIY